MKVVLTDAIMGRFAEHLGVGRDDHAWTIAVGWDDARLAAEVADADVLVCSAMSEPVARAALNVRLVHVTGAGVDRVPVDAFAPDARLCNTYHHGGPIAEHVLMTALMLRRRVLDVDAQMRSGVWQTVATDASVPFHDSLEGQTLGLLGIGGIGSEVARLARAFGMRVRAVRRDPAGSLPEGVEIDHVGSIADLPELMAASDVVVVTIPLDDSTRGIVGREAIAAMRPNGLLINVARGAVIDEDALVDALSSRSIGGAAIDVWWGAPDATAAPASVHRFASLPNTVLTPHFSGHARVVFERRAADIADNIARLAAGEPLLRTVRR